MHDQDMTNHPLDGPAVAGRLIMLRMVCRVMIGGLLTITFLIVCVVWFALDGQPIAGNAVQLGGISVVTLGAIATAMLTPVVAMLISGIVSQNGLRTLSTSATPPDAEKVLNVFAAATFAEFVIAEAVGSVNALLYHFTADAGLLVAVGGLSGFMIARFPTIGRVRRWFDTATEEIDRNRVNLQG